MAKKIDKTQWPENLFNDILVPNERYFCPENLDGLYQALDDFLTIREYAIIAERYHDGKTLNEIAELENVTKERIRQIIQKALRKLGRERSIEMIFGKYGTTSLLIKFKHELETEKVRLDTYREKILGQDIRDYPKAFGVTIDDISGMSVRTYNCLARAGYYFISDLLKALVENPDAISRIRNLGPKGVEEVKKYVDFYMERT